MDYELLRQFADSWGLLYLVLLFVGIVLFTFRRGSSKAAKETALIPFKEHQSDE